MTAAISRTTDVDSCLLLRRRVFIDEQGVSEADELDEYDAQAIHILARAGGVPVGTARIVVAGPVGKIGRVCVLPSYRGTGLGASLIRYALDLLTGERDVRVARLGAQAHSLGFYQRLDFAIVGPQYLDAGIAHFDMERPV